jgi:hypothetical protein
LIGLAIHAREACVEKSHRESPPLYQVQVRFHKVVRNWIGFQIAEDIVRELHDMSAGKRRINLCDAGHDSD